MDGNPVFCALDTADIEHAAALAEQVAPHVGGLKLGLEFFAAHGPAGIERLGARGLPIFLDLKFHDIPNTVAGAVRAVMPVRPALLTIHAAGGRAMMQAAVAAAREAADRRNTAPPRLVAVTVLTSLDQTDLAAIGIDSAPADQVLRLADLAMEAGLDGVVCSPHEVAALRTRLGPEALLVVPGIRPRGTKVGDQKRVMSPAEALGAGADILVIGRPITAAKDPAQAAAAIAGELDNSGAS